MEKLKEWVDGDDINKERKEKMKLYYVNNKEKELKRKKEYYIKNRESILERSKVFAANNSEKLKEKSKKYYAENREKVINKINENYINNKEEIDLKRKEHRKLEKSKLSKINSDLMANYNINIDIYNSMFEAQYGCCKICNKHQSIFKKRLAVDHDHNTGVIRGLLCGKCNVGLGQFDDNVNILISAINYLNKNEN